MHLGKTTPILRILDEAQAKSFYVDFLGFHIDWEHRFGEGYPLYLQVSQGGCVLHLSAHAGDCSTGAAMRIETDTLDSLQQRLAASTAPTAPHPRPAIQDMPGGRRDLSVIDPFGNRLTFTNSVGG